MRRYVPWSRRALLGALLLPCLLFPGIAQMTHTHAVAASRAAATGTPAAGQRGGSPTAIASGTSTPGAHASPTPTTIPDLTSGIAGGLSDSLLDDEMQLLQNGAPGLSSTVPLSNLPPIKGSVAALETQVIGLLSRVQSSSLSTATKNSLISRLLTLNLQLGPALNTVDQIQNLRAQENVLLQARVDAQASIDKLVAQIHIHLDKLRLGLQATVGADVTASVGSLQITVNGSANTIQAQLGANVNRLLVTVIADVDLLQIATLHATANVDTARLSVNLTALVKNLKLNLSLLLTKLSAHIQADVAAALTAEAQLTASLAAEVDGLQADLATNVDAKLGGLDALLASLITSLNATLTDATSTLQSIQSQVR